MIIREHRIKIDGNTEEFFLKRVPANYLELLDKTAGEEEKEKKLKEEVKLLKNYHPRDLIFFDLEHYVYKKPKCIGVFGAAVYDNFKKELLVTQYMIENKGEVVKLLYLAKEYFVRSKSLGKKGIVTFSGNNDFTVIKYLFEKFNIQFDFDKEFDSIDIQKEYERHRGTSIGLKNLEKVFDIYREGELISGSNLAKTFHKVLKDRDYIKRMPEDKIEKILLYNEQDVVNLYHIFVNWSKYINEETTEEEEVGDSKGEVLEEPLNETSKVQVKKDRILQVIK